MKYPYVIFFRLEKYAEIDNFFISNNEKLDCTLFFTSNLEQLNKLFNSNYQILITYGPDESDYAVDFLSHITDRMRSRWIHLKEATNIDTFNAAVNFCFVHNCAISRELVRPVFSVFSTTYNSYNKIIRAYNSLKAQTLKDWEWVVLDDSPDDNHFQFLRNLMLDDNRIRLYRKGENSGNIGNVKNEAVSLCRGKYILEFDHDDEILPFVLKDSADLFDAHKEVGFVYMDCICVYENFTNFFYGDFICKGYGAYYCQKYLDKWVYVYMTPNINNITLSHLVCCPNHPRIWRREALLHAGNYSEFLPICDDYEIILRTALTTKIAKIHKFGYVQYMNESNNNFSLIRNNEINRIGPHIISPIFYGYHKVHEKMKLLDAYEDESFLTNHSKIWERNFDSYEHKFCNLVCNPDYDKQICIIGIDSLLFNLERVKELYQNNERIDFILLENKSSTDYMFQKLDNYGFSRFKCYSFIDCPEKNLIQYFMTLYKSCDDIEIINNNVIKIAYNTDFEERHIVINSLTKRTQTYLEIGVEAGYTFDSVHFLDKIGVDPDEKVKGVIHKSSDDYFASDLSLKRDVIFIDGMHQSEYVLRDFNNSMNFLNEGGKIFVDDIIPLTFDEQLKIPNKHYYDNGILKYGEPWTGDVWKVIYYLLKYWRDNISFSVYHHLNYRGVAAIEVLIPFQINVASSMEEINRYNYFTDFDYYIQLCGCKMV
jgi:glycosyltransferase involved in cell wall biosynthesis